MARWEPNASDRLTKAAMELFAERGYDQTTVEQIAARAGLTERTFFRYFADKREVLFAGSTDLATVVREAIVAAAPAEAPLDVVAHAMEASGPFFDERRPHSRKRHALISAHPELRERELMKLTSLAQMLVEALEARGVAASTAVLAAEAGLAIFKVAFETWVRDPKDRGFVTHLRAARRELEGIVGGAGRSAARRG